MDEKRLPFVWELHYQNHTHIAVGTNHSDQTNYSSHAISLLDRVQRTCFEILPEESRDHKLTQKFHKSREKTFNKLLEEISDPEFRERLEQLSYKLRIKKSPDTPSYFQGVDAQLIHCSSELGIPRHSLETVEEQYEAMKTLATQFQIYTTIVKAVPELFANIISKIETEYDEHMKAYHEADIQLIKDKVRPNGNENLILRNGIMVDRSLEHMAQEPTLIAVGLMHYIGPQPTMLDLYREKGVEIKRI